MSYTALYRKLRPSSFKDVIGQPHIVKTLTNQIQTGRISHAYLFCGTRGTGKTSMAKVFAKAINCLTPDGCEPCNTCEMCLSINSNRSTNVIEIDAASNNSVENIRDLREDVKYPPASGTYKVYIIDEIHMLSNSAFNALLKTLEEPPANVVFILATTDPQKIPATILSRCQRFDFKRIGSAEMADKIRQYMREENFLVSDDALKFIVRISDGAMRDALSTLDQCIAYYLNEEITLDKVLDIIGSAGDEVFYEMTAALNEKNSDACMNIIEDLISNGRDVAQFVSELIVHFRNLLIVKSIQNTSNALDFSLENIEKLTENCEGLSQSFLIELINIFSELSASLRYSSNDRISLEIVCIKICNPILGTSYDAITSRIESLENALEKGVQALPPEKPENTEAPKKNPKKTIKAKAVPDDIKNVINNYDNFTAGFDVRLKASLKNCFPGSLENNLLYIVCSKKIHLDYIKTKHDIISGRLAEVFGKTFDIAVILKEDYDSKHLNMFGAADENASMIDYKKLEEIDFPIINS